MAGGAMRQIIETALVSPGDTNLVRVADLAERIALSATSLGRPWEVRMRDLGSSDTAASLAWLGAAWLVTTVLVTTVLVIHTLVWSGLQGIPARGVIGSVA
jgi:hypothetical protein